MLKRTNKQIRRSKGRVDRAKLAAATEEQIAAWKRKDDIDDDALGTPRYIPRNPNVQALRERLGLSQEAFASRYRLSLRTVQEWEQQRREPSEPARALLYAINRDPEGLAQALR